MNHCRTGKISETSTEGRQEITSRTHCCQETIGTPGPVTNDWINEARNANAVENITSKACAANHCARCNGRSCICECKLENPVCQYGNARCLVSSRRTRKKKPMSANETIAVTE